MYFLDDMRILFWINILSGLFLCGAGWHRVFLCHEYDIFAMNMIFDFQGIGYAHIKKLTFVKRGQADDALHVC